jgi:hypothetical protein
MPRAAGAVVALLLLPSVSSAPAGVGFNPLSVLGGGGKQVGFLGHCECFVTLMPAPLHGLGGQAAASLAGRTQQ